MFSHVDVSVVLEPQANYLIDLCMGNSQAHTLSDYPLCCKWLNKLPTTYTASLLMVN